MILNHTPYFKGSLGFFHLRLFEGTKSVDTHDDDDDDDDVPMTQPGFTEHMLCTWGIQEKKMTGLALKDFILCQGDQTSPPPQLYHGWQNWAWNKSYILKDCHIVFNEMLPCKNNKCWKPSEMEDHSHSPRLNSKANSSVSLISLVTVSPIFLRVPKHRVSTLIQHLFHHALLVYLSISLTSLN